MIRTADNLGIRVLVDLVMSHTSNQHAWFQRSRHDRTSRFRDYYRWSDTKQKEPSEVAFPGEKPGVKHAATPRGTMFRWRIKLRRTGTPA